MSEIPVQSQLTPLVNTVARIIAIMNNKGGAGKTSTITNLAMSLAHAGRRVLLIDGDQQANSTEVMANGKKYYAQYGHTICDLYNNPRFSIFDAIIPAVSGEEVIDNLYIIPSDPSFERVMENCLTRHHREKILSRHLQSVMDKFDYILIDCSPGLNLSTTNAAYTADHVLIPVDGGSFALTGLDVVLDYLDEIRETRFTRFSVFRNEYNGAKKKMNTYLHEQLASNERTRDNYLETRIRADENISQAQVACVPLWYYNKGSLALNDYRALMRELETLLSNEAA
ncbi:TPA: AAA family ATPase [Salmonella enterica]|jgi:chromosome partitioning protein|uniref:Chromosome partitioning protein ParA n=12 Tax=Enterobacteriaceae TaxID=543 RepID=A0A7R7EDJ2_CITFR|nr:MULTISPECIES: AAA family ATPase [Enterobacterales]EAB3906970.1 ParA family protein [Salmonella enterica]EAB7503637.1 ParA family protein [Salmonella enterica subsp. enterica]EBQ9892678.1 chromosome partitioning protein ParA [Salmonella enterica subsp. enterica serovar Hvittingfoss]EBS2857808.1 ParA family protein [Salmonella enterica subsp. enterica serovar Richmond]EBS4510142.1 ParA family protein [Salmonella enterica subsp. enterica serovar Adamstua]EBW4541697.1 ParA family protein [Salm